MTVTSNSNGIAPAQAASASIFNPLTWLGATGIRVKLQFAFGAAAVMTVIAAR